MARSKTKKNKANDSDTASEEDIANSPRSPRAVRQSPIVDHKTETPLKKNKSKKALLKIIIPKTKVSNKSITEKDKKRHSISKLEVKLANRPNPSEVENSKLYQLSEEGKQLEAQEQTKKVRKSKKKEKKK